MSFDVEMMSDQQIDVLLHMTVKIPRWKLENTQTERESKRIRQAQRHLKELEEQRKQEKLKQRRLVNLRKAKAEREAEAQHKRRQQNKKPSHIKDESDDLAL